MVLEGLCAAKAAERVSPADADDFARIVERRRDAVAGGDVIGYSDLNQALHHQIATISGQHAAVRTIERLRAQLVRHQFRLALRSGRPAASLPEHEQIIDAVIRRDPDRADRAMRTHLRSVIEELRRTDADRP